MALRSEPLLQDFFSICRISFDMHDICLGWISNYKVFCGRPQAASSYSAALVCIYSWEQGLSSSKRWIEIPMVIFLQCDDLAFFHDMFGCPRNGYDSGHIVFGRCGLGDLSWVF